jgi:hypothetical protein
MLRDQRKTVFRLPLDGVVESDPSQPSGVNYNVYLISDVRIVRNFAISAALGTEPSKY